jgi:hypothetical protein
MTKDIHEHATSENSASGSGRCRFITSFGGAVHCADTPALLGFCPFHFDAFERGEIDLEGRISDRLDDQSRRREINFHGIRLPEDLRPIL